MRHPLFIAIALLVLGMGLINGSNNALPRLFLLVLFIVYIIIPLYVRMHNLVSRYLQARKHQSSTRAWA